jgi:cytosine/adenosine deaminase-related metal-dependent hydrolase
MAGLDSQVGSLTPGKQADIILLRADDLAMFPVTDPVASVVMQGGIGQVDTVLVAGRIVKRDGHLLYGPLAEKKTALRKSGERILTDFGLLPSQAA